MFAERTNWNLKTNRLSEALSRRRAAGKSLLDLTDSNPTQCGFEFDGKAILRALANRASLVYQPNPKGLEAARRAVAAYYADRGEEVPIENVVLTTSTSEAYSFVFRTLCNFGDELLIPAPSYPLFDFLADIQDVRLVRYPLVYDHGWQIDLHALERAVTARTRGVIVVHPNNPTGHFCKPEEIEKLNEICFARQIAVIADEVFLDFVMTGGRPSTFASNPSVLTFTMSGLSKIAGLPQMKVAWVIVSGAEPGKTQALERLEFIADTYLSVAIPVQLATPLFLEQRRAFQKQLIGRAQNNLAELDRQLDRQERCSRLELEGGWYAVILVPGTRSDEDLAIELLTTKDVYVHPGHFYDFPTDGHLVVSLITPEKVFAEGVARLLDLF